MSLVWESVSPRVLRIATASVRTGFAMTPPLEAAQQHDKYEFKITSCVFEKDGVYYQSAMKYTPAGVMELVDVVDSKSTAGDSVPVRVRSPAPKKQIPIWVSAFLLYRWTRTHLNATRMSVAADGLTEANLNFLPTGENANRVRSPCPYYQAPQTDTGTS